MEIEPMRRHLVSIMVEGHSEDNDAQRQGVGADALWLDGWRRIRDASAGFGGHTPSDEDAAARINRLLEVVDGDDPLLAFMAAQAVRDAVIEADTIAGLRVTIRSIATIDSSSPAIGRLQLLRHIIKKARDELDAADSDSKLEDDSSDDQSEGVREGGRQRQHVLADQILDCFELLEPVLVRAVEDPYRHSALEVREVLLVLASFVKLVSTDRQAVRGDSLSAICSLISRIATDLLTSSSERDIDIPTVLLCALFDLLMDSRTAFVSANQSWTSIVSSVMSPAHWITSKALELLHDEINSDAACSTSFSSVDSPYPFLQKWIEFCSICADAVLLNESLKGTDLDDATQLTLIQRLPSRKQLLHVLSEQDDTMIASLLHIQSITVRAGAPGAFQTLPDKIRRYVESELSPDLMFAELLNVFRDDHLVLVDMLMSSETRLLELFMQYLRLAEETWPRPLHHWSSLERAESVVSVLIRLRLELTRLVDGGLFPYNVRPLLRRLERLEGLYEATLESLPLRSTYVGRDDTESS